MPDKEIDENSGRVSLELLLEQSLFDLLRRHEIELFDFVITNAVLGRRLFSAFPIVP